MENNESGYGEFVNLKPQLNIPNTEIQCQEWTGGYDNSYPHRKQALEERARVRNWEVNKCQNHAKYRIDGFHMCHQHAAEYALKRLEGMMNSKGGD